MHPVYLAVSLTGALAYDIHLKGRKAVRFAVMGLLPMAALAALLNPVFNHEGATILTYLPSGESADARIHALWCVGSGHAGKRRIVVFSSYNEVMTSDKFVYLFGRVIPALSLVLSIACGSFRSSGRRCRTVSEAQACIGRDTKTERIPPRWERCQNLLNHGHMVARKCH